VTKFATLEASVGLEHRTREFIGVLITSVVIVHDGLGMSDLLTKPRLVCKSLFHTRDGMCTVVQKVS